MTNMLDADRIREIAAAYRLAGLPHKRGALSAANLAARLTEASRAAFDVSSGVQLFGMVNEIDPLDVKYAAQAGSNAGFAVATEDLIGLAGYTYREFASLVSPWYAGFPDVPVLDEEGKQHDLED
jgi:hypothetical protein